MNRQRFKRLPSTHHFQISCPWPQGQAFQSLSIVANFFLPAYEESNSVGSPPQQEYLYNYCDQPAYDMNGLVLEVYRALGRPKTRLFHWPYPGAYFGGLCFDLFALILRRRLPISSIRVKKFCQNTYFTSSRVADTGFVPPVSLPDGLSRTIHYEFVKKVQGHTFSCE